MEFHAYIILNIFSFSVCYLKPNQMWISAEMFWRVSCRISRAKHIHLDLWHAGHPYRIYLRVNRGGRKTVQNSNVSQP